MNRSKDPEYWMQKKARRKAITYPLATIAYYGPDDQFASKVVVGIVLGEDEDPASMQKWFSSDLDVRQDKTINAEILEYLDQNNVNKAAITDRIIGCPHEEGIDYPAGEKCPQCLFWANRDLRTGEIIS